MSFDLMDYNVRISFYGTIPIDCHYHIHNSAASGTPSADTWSELK